jgi:hypothetical protein
VKWKTFGKAAEVIARMAVPHAGEVIDAGKAIAHAHSSGDRALAIMTEIDAALDAAGDLSGKSAVNDPALRALLHKYVEDGLALHQYIEAHKAAAAPFVQETAADLGIFHGSTGE